MHNAIYSNLLLPISSFFIFIFSSPLSLYSLWFCFIIFSHWIFYVHFYIFFFPPVFVVSFYTFRFRVLFILVRLIPRDASLSAILRAYLFFPVTCVYLTHVRLVSFDQTALKLIKAGSYVRVSTVLRYGKLPLTIYAEHILLDMNF